LIVQALIIAQHHNIRQGRPMKYSASSLALLLALGAMGQQTNALSPRPALRPTSSTRRPVHSSPVKANGGGPTKESQWLNWVYREFMEQEVGKLSSNVLSKIVPAMSGWSRTKSHHGALKAQEMLERYVHEHSAGNDHAVLETRHFNAVMDAWAKSRREDAPDQVQAIIKWMNELRLKDPELNVKPDVISMSTLVIAWSRTKGGSEQALSILQYMERKGLAPNTVTYNSVLMGLVHCPDREKALKAEQIIHRMEQRFQNGYHECRPDVYSYQSLIAAWSRTTLAGTPQRAEEVLHFLDKKSKEGRSELTPNVHCFTAAIHAWSHSSERSKARRAYQILQHMRELYQAEQNPTLKPNVVTYTAVMNACAMPADTEERDTALQIAQLTLEELRYCGEDAPNFLTYSAMLHVIATTRDEGDARDALAKQAFVDACRDGQVGRIVMEKFGIAASKEVYLEVLGDFVSNTEIAKLPIEWTRNVKGEQEPHHRRSSMKEAFDQKLSAASFSKLQQVRFKEGTSGHYSKERDTVQWSIENLETCVRTL
jgi:hypothetical protein